MHVFLVFHCLNVEKGMCTDRYKPYARCVHTSLTCVQCTGVLVLQPELSEHKTLNKSVCTTRTPVHSALVKHYLCVRCLAIKAICQNKNIWSENRRRISDLESLRQCLLCILECDPPVHRHERFVLQPLNRVLLLVLPICYS